MHGSTLRAVRERAGITRKALAETVGCHWTYIGMIERGERAVSFATACGLWEALGRADEVHPRHWDESFGTLLESVQAPTVAVA